MRNVMLHGGPWHGKAISIFDDRDHIHVVQALPPAKDAEPEAEIITRNGKYSQVSGQPTNFEWDGWSTK